MSPYELSLLLETAEDLNPVANTVLEMRGKLPRQQQLEVHPSVVVRNYCRRHKDLDA